MFILPIARSLPIMHLIIIICIHNYAQVLGGR